MSAREQARDSAARALGWEYKHTAREVADIASDVWEPLLRSLVIGLEGQLEGRDAKRLLAHNLHIAYTRAKEALDDE